MGNLRKSYKNAGRIGILAAGFSLVLAGLACNRAAPPNQMAVDGSDAKAAADGVAAAEPLYQGREDLNKARVAVATLRQARTADYGNYEAAWKLARAAFYVAEHTDNNSERDDMYREGTEAGKAAVTLQPNK